MYTYFPIKSLCHKIPKGVPLEFSTSLFKTFMVNFPHFPSLILDRDSKFCTVVLSSISSPQFGLDFLVAKWIT